MRDYDVNAAFPPVDVLMKKEPFAEGIDGFEQRRYAVEQHLRFVITRGKGSSTLETPIHRHFERNFSATATQLDIDNVTRFGKNIFVLVSFLVVEIFFKSLKNAIKQNRNFSQKILIFSVTLRVSRGSPSKEHKLRGVLRVYKYMCRNRQRI